MKLRPGTFEEYSAYVNKLKLAADSLNSQAKRIQQQQNNANASADRVRVAQAKALQPYLTQVQLAFKNLRLLEDDLSGLLENNDIIDKYFDQKTLEGAVIRAETIVENVRNTDKGCVAFNSLSMQYLGQTIETVYDLSKSIPEAYNDLSLQIDKTEDVIKNYKTKLSQYPKSGLEEVSNTTMNAHKMLKTLNSMNEKLSYMIKGYTRIRSRFEKLNTAYISLQLRCDGGN